MSDALASLEVISGRVSELGEASRAGRSKTLAVGVAQPLVRVIAKTYFESVRSELISVQSRSGLVDEIDFLVQTLLQLASIAREKQSYIGHVNELAPLLLAATVDLMKAAGSPRLVLSQTEKAVLNTLASMLPVAAASYEQALRDLTQGGRVSWRGTAAEIREVLREVIDHLAPDEKVSAGPGFQLEAGRSGPTQRQKVRFILRARRSSSAAVSVAESSLSTVDEAVATLARSTYQRGAVSTHSRTNDAEIRNLKRYAEALLAELLETG
jgi:hypothetical protein